MDSIKHNRSSNNINRDLGTDLKIPVSKIKLSVCKGASIIKILASFLL